MARVLADEALYEFIGGRPPTRAELRDRYGEARPAPQREGEALLSWIVRSRPAAVAMGSVQATVTSDGSGAASAELSWVVGTEFQRHGVASEAAAAVVAYLRGRGIERFSAHIVSCHRASETVARRIGLQPTGQLHDGEIIWSND